MLMILAVLLASPEADAAFTAARFADIDTGVTRQKPVIVVKDERVVSIRFDGQTPSGVKVVDLGDITLLPGLIDAHTHLMASANSDGYAAMLSTQSQAARALAGAAIARKTLYAGFTSVRDVENEGSAYADVALRDAIAKGYVIGPRMWVATRAIAVIGQYYPFHISPDLPDFPRGAQMVSGVEEARRAAREQLANGADHLKVYADWTYPTFTVDELKAIVDEATKAGKKVAAHARTVQGIRNAIAAGVVSIEHGWGADKPTLELMKKQGMWLVPTIGALDVALENAKDAAARARAQERLGPALEMVKNARAIGVKIASGYDAGNMDDQGNNAHELVTLNRAGFTPLEVLRMATTNAAALIGKSADIGSLTPGHFADMIGVAGDPLAEVSTLGTVVVVVKSGTVVRDAR